MTKITYEPVLRAMERLKELSADEETRRLAEVREKVLRDNEAEYREAVYEGRLKGARESLLLQLAVKFDGVPDRLKSRIGTADYPQLQFWPEKILFADSLDDILK
jgi:predicted DNA-binding protein (UPF0278 family)